MNKFKFGDKVQHVHNRDIGIFIRHGGYTGSNNEVLSYIFFENYDRLSLVYESDLKPVSEWIACSERIYQNGKHTVK